MPNFNPNDPQLRAAILAAGHDPGSVINEADVAAALKNLGHNYGTTVNVGDVKVLFDKTGKTPSESERSYPGPMNPEPSPTYTPGEPAVWSGPQAGNSGLTFPTGPSNQEPVPSSGSGVRPIGNVSNRSPAPYTTGLESTSGAVQPNPMNTPPLAPEPEEEKSNLPSAEAMAAVMAGLGLPQAFLSEFIRLWVQEGSPDLALAMIRNDRALYDLHFPGNRRNDGSLRHSEQEYLSIIEGYEDTVRQRGLNPDLFRSAGTWASGIENAWSPLEFEASVSAIEEGIFQRGEEIMRAFSEASGGIAFTREAVLTSLIDNKIGDELLTRKISVAQVRGTAAQFGFSRSIQRGNRLYGAGVNEASAREFYSDARRQVGSLTESARRFNDPDDTFGVDDLEAASLLSDPKQRQRAMHLRAREVGSFGRQIGVAGQGNALTGLKDR